MYIKFKEMQKVQMQIFGKNELHVRLETLRGEMEEIEISSYKGRWGLTMGG